MPATAYAIVLSAILFAIWSIGDASNQQMKLKCEPPSFRQCDVSMPEWPACWCEEPQS